MTQPNIVCLGRTLTYPIVAMSIICHYFWIFRNPGDMIQYQKYDSF